MGLEQFFPEILYPNDHRFTPQPPPSEGVCDAPCVCVTMNESWWAHVSGQIARLARYDAWVGTDEEKADAVQSIYKILDVGRFNMGCGCGGSNGALTRYDDEGNYQVSYDGGETWIDAPTQDPRNNVTLAPPPTVGEGENGKCKAANAGVAMFKRQQNDNEALLSGGASLAEFNAQVVAFIVAAGLAGGVGVVVGALVVLIGAIAAFVASLGADAFDDAFTDEVWSRLLCRLYCNMGDDFSFTDDQFNAVKADTLTEENFIVRTWMDKYLYAIGAKGLTNLIRSGAVGTMSCDDCGCDPCEAYQLYTSGFSTLIDYDPENCRYLLEAVIDPTNPSRYIIGFDFNAPNCANVANIELVQGSLSLAWGWKNCGAPSESYGLWGGGIVEYAYNASCSSDCRVWITTAPPA